MAERCETCGFLPCRCEDLAAGYMGNAQSAAGWPRRSEALGCHPKQIEQQMEFLKRRGVPTEFTPDGAAVVTCPGHQKQLLKALGYVDRGKKVITVARGSKGLQQRI
jgi:hypothetical protein